MKNLTKALLSCLVAIFCIGSSNNYVKAEANSAQRYWEGISATGALIMDETCPIEVQHEKLVFDLQEFPANYYNSAQSFLEYSGKVSAQYTFYNPTDYMVKATLAFPFGRVPYYADTYDETSGEYNYSIDAEKYDVMVDGVPVEKEIRYTLAGYFDNFNIEMDLPQIKDGYVEDEFYSPLLPVTRYYYEVTGIDAEVYRSAYACFTYKGDYTKNRIWVVPTNGAKEQKNGITLGSWAGNNGKTFEVYVIGEPLTEELNWKIYQNASMDEEIAGDVILRRDKIGTMTFEEFVYNCYFGEYQRANGVSQFDWYNAVVYSLNECLDKEYGYIKYMGMNAQTEFMRWYQYEIEIPAKSTIVNTVTAPMYPSINAHYEPPIYGYTYLLSPAKTWKTFGSLDIEIHTPYYLFEDSFGFTKTEYGYALSLEGLPDGELGFTLSTSETPKDMSAKRGCQTAATYLILIPFMYLAAGCNWVGETVGCSSAIGGALPTALVFVVLLFMKKRK